jgi:hypothetical protein
VLNGATQAAVATFHRRLDAFVHDERSYQAAVDLRLSAIEDTQALILAALNTLPNQLAAQFNAQLAANPPAPAQQQQNRLVPPLIVPPAAADQVSLNRLFLFTTCYLLVQLSN